MESGNSSTSMQSSNRADGGIGGGCGGDEEYNSRADQSLSAIINNQIPCHVSTGSLHNHQTHFDNTNNNPFIPNFFTNNNPTFPPNLLATSAPSLPAHHAPDHVSTGCIGMTTKSRKKRTRTSRRAPTTVLTTDTSNFRAMVQEFTGIPGTLFPPATANNFLGFPSLSSSSSSLLRPLAQKMMIPNFLSSSSSSFVMDHYQTLNLQQSQKDPVCSFSTGKVSNQMNHLKPCTDHGSADEFGIGCSQNIILSQNEKNNEIGVVQSSSSKMTSKRTEGMVDSWICSSDQGT